MSLRTRWTRWRVGHASESVEAGLCHHDLAPLLLGIDPLALPAPASPRLP